MKSVGSDEAGETRGEPETAIAEMRPMPSAENVEALVSELLAACGDGTAR